MPGRAVGARSLQRNPVAASTPCWFADTCACWSAVTRGSSQTCSRQQVTTDQCWPSWRSSALAAEALAPAGGVAIHELAGELLEEQADVGDDPAGLRGAAVGELGDGRRVDVDAHQGH